MVQLRTGLVSWVFTSTYLCNLLSWRLAVLERTEGPPGPGAGAHWGFRLQLLAIKSLPYVALFFAGMIIEPHIRSVLETLKGLKRPLALPLVKPLREPKV